MSLNIALIRFILRAYNCLVFSLGRARAKFWGFFCKKIGKDVILLKNCHIRGPQGISIDDHTFINFNVLLDGHGELTIGKNVLIGQNSTILSSQHNISNRDISIPLQGIISNRVIIEDDSWIGCNVIILPGIKISKGSIIGAGSIVTKDTASYSINAGNPAKFIRYRD
jgi:acetyltransferase-like isoleucine patch superfamily enzyme